MRTAVIGICTQTHPEPRGYANDDHIQSENYTVNYEDQQIEEAVNAKIEEINDRATRQLKNHGQKVGHTWIIKSQTVTNEDHPNCGDTSGTQMLQILNQV